MLGWSNQNKIDALLDEEGRLARRIDALVTMMGEHQQRKEAADKRLHALSALAEYRDPAGLDWPAAVRDIAERRRDLSAIRASSNVLQTLTEEREQVRGSLAEIEDRIKILRNDAGRLDGDRERVEDALAQVDRAAGR